MTVTSKQYMQYNIFCAYTGNIQMCLKHLSNLHHEWKFYFSPTVFILYLLAVLKDLLPTVFLQAGANHRGWAV